MNDTVSDFTLHPRLEADTKPVTRLALSRVLLMNDSRYPWLILVPEKPGLKDLHDLSPEDRIAVMGEIDTVSRVLGDLHSPDKINVAALGNMVPQLHVHVIARFTTDAAWPSPVWGAGDAKPYDEGLLSETLQALHQALA